MGARMSNLRNIRPAPPGQSLRAGRLGGGAQKTLAWRAPRKFREGGLNSANVYI